MTIKTIQSVQRSLDIINCFSTSNPKLSLKKISNMLDLNINTARGLLNTLLLNGYISKGKSDNKYSLGLEFTSKSKLVYKTLIKNVRELAIIHMNKLTDKYNVNCMLQVTSYHHIYNVENIIPKKSHYMISQRTDTQLPLHTTASGKLLIAYLDVEDQFNLIENMDLIKLTKNSIHSKTLLYNNINKVKKAGYATEFEETDVGVSSVAVPFFNSKNSLAGTLSITGPASVISDIFYLAVVDLNMIAEKITSALKEVTI